MLDLRIDEHFVIRVFNYRPTSKTFGRKVTGTCAVNSDVIACKKASQRLVSQVIDSRPPSPSLSHLKLQAGPPS